MIYCAPSLPVVVFAPPHDPLPGPQHPRQYYQPSPLLLTPTQAPCCCPQPQPQLWPAVWVLPLLQSVLVPAQEAHAGQG
jgi:hypothetical protein